MEAEVKRRKRRVVLVALAACLVVAGIGGTLAWFSAQSSLTNTFKVGNITDPTTKPDKPSENLPSDTTKVSGNIYEPSWVDQSAIAQVRAWLRIRTWASARTASLPMCTCT